VRFSDPIALPADSILVHVDVQLYDTPSAPADQAIHFQNAYKLTKQSGVWRAVTSARIPRR
jgi:hypothetical protein